MSFFKDLFKKNDQPIRSYDDFWDWFRQHEKTFHKAIQDNNDIETVFFDPLSAKLNELRKGFFFLTGMADDSTAELVLTADGEVKNIVFVEKLVDAAPRLDGWLFTALKPALDIKDVTIRMDGYTFSAGNMSFYANNQDNFPDEIDISVVHDDLTDNNKEEIRGGVFIFLDNFLGELNFVTTIDDVNIIPKKDAVEELIPIEKLKDYLIWREKEFVEKYEDTWRDTSHDSYSLLESTLKSGNTALATINTGILRWDGKSSHPWILLVKIHYNGASTNGMPDAQTSALLNEIEDELMESLKDLDGYLNIGRQTAESVREIYFACKEFRKLSLMADQTRQKYSTKLTIEYEIYKDKYWRTFDHYVQV